MTASNWPLLERSHPTILVWHMTLLWALTFLPTHGFHKGPSGYEVRIPSNSRIYIYFKESSFPNTKTSERTDAKPIKRLLFGLVSRKFWNITFIIFPFMCVKLFSCCLFLSSPRMERCMRKNFQPVCFGMSLYGTFWRKHSFQEALISVDVWGF